MAAKIQWVKQPIDCPCARSSLGKISEMKTQMTAPCPTACEAINMKTNIGNKELLISAPENEKAIRSKDTIYPNEPMYINFFLPILSIRNSPNMVATIFITPIPTVDSKALSALIPAISKILGAK